LAERDDIEFTTGDEDENEDEEVIIDEMPDYHQEALRAIAEH
jgi:hypothetical protein